MSYREREGVSDAGWSVSRRTCRARHDYDLELDVTLYEVFLHIFAGAGILYVGTILWLTAIMIYGERKRRNETTTMLREQLAKLAQENQELKEETRWN